MSGFSYLVPALACLPFAYLMTGWLRGNAARLGLVQVPNHRSSHTVPTPRGGGLAVALAAALYGAWVAPAAGAAAGWIVVLTLAFAILGLADDLRDLSASLRFVVQALLAALFLANLPALPPVEFGQIAVAGGLLTALLLFGLLWWINLFNFMDGIDGIAGSQAVFMFLAGAWLSGPHGADGLWWWLVASAAASAGFLAWNLPPARIFMGDSGSNAIAFLIAALALMSVTAGWMSYAQWAVLASLFVADATVTLLRRMANGERWFAPHRQHAYQHLARRHGHRAVTVAYGAANLVFVAPMAYAAGRIGNPWAIVVLTYLLLAAPAYLLGAGRREHD